MEALLSSSLRFPFTLYIILKKNSTGDWSCPDQRFLLLEDLENLSVGLLHHHSSSSYTKLETDCKFRSILPGGKIIKLPRLVAAEHTFLISHNYNLYDSGEEEEVGNGGGMDVVIRRFEANPFSTRSKIVPFEHLGKMHARKKKSVCIGLFCVRKKQL